MVHWGKKKILVTKCDTDLKVWTFFKKKKKNDYGSMNNVIVYLQVYNNLSF